MRLRFLCATSRQVNIGALLIDNCSQKLIIQTCIDLLCVVHFGFYLCYLYRDRVCFRYRVGLVQRFQLGFCL